MRLLISLYLLGSIASATSFVVPAGTVETDTQTMLGIGDTGLVEEGGELMTAGNSVNMNNDNQRMVNRGIIESTGGATEGISSTGNDNVIENYGSISTTGGGSTNISIFNSGGDRVLIKNYGQVTTLGTDGDAIGCENASDVVIENFGSLLTNANEAEGIVCTTCTNLQMINHGIISTVGVSSECMRTFASPDTTMINNGTSTSTANSAAALFAGGGSDRTTMVNNGTIITRGANNARGITGNSSRDLVMINTGTISTIGTNSIAINSNFSRDSFLVNSGSLFVSNTNSRGMNLNSSRDSIMINIGSIVSIGGVRADGMRINNSLASIAENSGTIFTTGNDAEGIIVEGNSSFSQITNTGLIVTEGQGGQGIVVASADNVIVKNGGVITVSNFNTAAILINNDADNVQFINSGTLRSINGLAMNFATNVNNPTLTLLRGSRIQGAINTNVDPLNVNVESGLNLGFAVANQGLGNLNIGAPFAVLGNFVGVIDPAGLALQSDVLADLSDTFLNGIYRHKTTCNPGSGPWMQGIGSYRQRSKTDVVGYSNRLGGFLGGYDLPFLGGYANLFGGIACGNAEVNQQTQQVKTTSYVGGIAFERFLARTFVGLAILAGQVDWDNTRYVMNNLAPSGVDTARAKTEGVVVSPEITVARLFNVRRFRPIATATVRYAGLFLNRMSETGSATNLTVQGRDIDLITARGELALPFGSGGGASCLNVQPYVGASGRFQLRGEQIQAELLGQPLSFDAGSPQNLGAVLVGFRGNQAFRGFNFVLNVEASYDGCNSARVMGEGGLGLTF